MLELQQRCFNNIKTLCVNYKKDSATRKNEEYLTKRLESLEAQWKDFEERHQYLVETYEDKNINYFTENIFENTKELYETTKKSLQELLNEMRDKKPVEFDLTGMLEDSATSESSSLTPLLEKQLCNFKALDRAMSKINLKTIKEKWELQDHLSILKSKWEVIDKLHWELEAKLKGSNAKYYNMFVGMEDKYDEMRRSLNSRIWSSVHYETSAPKMEIPEFSGNYTQWISFKDLFTETIHNNPMINNAQKMQHLKSKLRGEAERLVQHLSISADNYNSCWEILTQRYENRRLQFTSFLNTMLNLPTIQHPDNYNLKKMHDVITESLNGLSNIGIDTTTWDPLIVHLMSQKLDRTTYSEYMKELQDHRELQVLSDFLYFLESKFMAYETMKNLKKETTTTQYQKHTFSKVKNYPIKNNYETKKTYTTTYGQCPNCNGDHVLMKCAKFNSMNAMQRNNTVSKLRVCENCLFSHGNDKCTSSKTCKECNMKHHTLLHNPVKKNSFGTKMNETNLISRSSTSSQPSSNHLSSDDLEVLLPTVQLLVKSVNGTYIKLRALLDQGSQVNLINERAAQLLRLPRKRLDATITGVGTVSGDCKGCLQLSCKSTNSDYSFETKVLIMKKLINNLPNSSFKKANWPHLENLELADPDFQLSRPIDILLGADVYSDIILEGVRKGSQQSPIAQQTQLGWILCGKLKTLNCNVTLIDLNEISKYWESEDIVQNDYDLSKENYCEKYYSESVQRASNGKYIVKMPFCFNYEEKLGNSRSIAISQFLQLEKRLEKNYKLDLMYRDFIEEYKELGHMKPSSSIPTNIPQCYLPHHGVLREQSTTTKLRVVFNASQKTTSGFSLNQLQEKGPNLQKDIQALIMKWRSYKYAYTADIEKMYRCIEITQDQQKLQKIIWRNSPTEKLQEYDLCTVTYGMKCAPWLAMRTLKQLAMDDGHNHPEAALVLQQEFYVDDLVSGHNSVHEAIKLQRSLIELLQSGGMNLRKWSANDPALLENLAEHQISTNNNFDFKHEESMKTLGLGWNPENDTFSFNWELDNKPNTKLTKRILLSEISKLYDPLGWLSPVTITAKLIFQRIWKAKVEWDMIIPSEILKDWLKLRSELSLVKEIKLSRWLGGQQSNIKLLGFCDASEKAYACVIYSYVTNSGSPPTINLLAAKTRVAPLTQKTTLPRMELCGALLLSHLIEKIQEAFKGYELKVRAWCDSQIVLAWLKGDATKWERYVANRVAQIKRVIPSENWQYVKSEHNPADCASRGLDPSKLINYNLWWKGPEFLKTLKENEDKTNLTCFYTTDVELKTNKVEALTMSQENNFIEDLLNNCSSLSRVTRVTAWILRFIANARGYKKLDTAYLTTAEITAANDQLIKFIQRTEFINEYEQLMKNETITTKSKIYKLNPYLDKRGIIRVGGRIDNSNLSFEMKHPAILPRQGRFTQLLIEQAHFATLHGGARLTLVYIRQRYWIIGGNRAVKAKLRNCVRCHRHKSIENQQIMGDLPQQRITPSRPFTHTGVDFTGYVEVKLNKGRGIKTSKGYICIFVCMATKAVHIELVSDLSTETFIAAFQRMCARRGTPKHVYSDCGTNFIGASKILRKEFEEFKQQLSPEFFDHIGKLEVEWHFNAPAWPTAGGLWEAAVKSMKYHLRRVLGDQKLTYEEFQTLLTQIEACMNSRPLCPLTEDLDEFHNCLTPGHFLIGGPVMSLPISDYSDDRNINLRRRWQLTENMLQQFWKNWSNEYLTQLQGRSKWNKPTKNIQKDDIVLIKDNNLPPGKWAMGRVLETHPGADGYVRVTTLKTQTGVIKRPVVKLSPLPLQTENSVELLKNSNTIEINQQDTSTKRLTRSKKTKMNQSSLFASLATLLTLFTFISGSYGAVTSGAHITALEPNRPVYYDTIGKVQMIHDEWTLLMYYNLTNYWNGIKLIENYLQNLNELCEQTDPRYCKTTLTQLSHEMELLNYYNVILLTPHKHLYERKKRGLVNGIGSIANTLFGVLDQQFAEKYQKDIETIQNNENYLLSLTKNQTSIVELENKVLRKTEENINRQVAMIEDYMNQTDKNLAKIESAMEVMMATNYFSSASLTTYLLLKNMRTMQEMLLDSLTDVYKGHMDVHLLTPVNLITQLSDISGKLPKSLTLPVEDIGRDIKSLYKVLYAKARVTADYFLFEVHIPLTSDEEFLLYKPIALPVNTEKGIAIMELQSQYVAVNFHKNTYVSITESDVKLCAELKQDTFICYKNIPVFNLHNENAPCEAKLLGHRSGIPCDVRRTSCNDAWIALHTPNSWLAVCCEACTLRTVCNNDVTSHTMTSSGIVTLMQGCVLQSKDFTIHSNNEYNSKMKIDYDYLNASTLNSSVNKIIDLTRHNMSLSILHGTRDAEIEEIERRLKSLRGNEVLPSSISSHDIHQYSLCYILLGAALIVTLWLIKKRIGHYCANKGVADTPANEAIELKQIENHLRSAPPSPAPAAPPRASDRQRTPIITAAKDNVTFSFDE